MLTVCREAIAILRSNLARRQCHHQLSQKDICRKILTNFDNCRGQLGTCRLRLSAVAIAGNKRLLQVPMCEIHWTQRASYGNAEVQVDSHSQGAMFCPVRSRHSAFFDLVPGQRTGKGKGKTSKPGKAGTGKGKEKGWTESPDDSDAEVGEGGRQKENNGKGQKDWTRGAIFELLVLFVTKPILKDSGKTDQKGSRKGEDIQCSCHFPNLLCKILVERQGLPRC